MLIKIFKTIFVIGGLDFGMLALLFAIYGITRTIFFEGMETDADLPNGWENAFDTVFIILACILIICFGLLMSIGIALLFKSAMNAIWFS